jgi:pyrroloquinoline quinone (PQQ) biosynthesis protein C
MKGKGMTTEYVEDNAQVLASTKERLARHPATHHRFLLEFERQHLSDGQMERFAIQWYKTARGHKEAFPALIYNTRNDDIRCDLIEILSEEYGYGDRERIHAKLLKRFLSALSISDNDVENAETLPAVKRFVADVLSIWKEDDPIYAFGLHFSLEYLAASLHVHLANGLAKYAFLKEDDKEYFNYHKMAEQRHADFSEKGFVLYATDPENQPLLERGVDKGGELLDRLWDEFYYFIFMKEETSTVTT